MKVFLTGGTGSIGKAVLANLLTHNHQVTCTVKDATSHASLQSSFPSFPNLTIVDHLLSSATGAILTHLSTGFDSIIHIAQSRLDTSHELELATVDAFIAAGKATATAGRPCHLIITTGTGVLGSGDEIVDEDSDTDHPISIAAARVLMEKYVLTSAGGGFSTAIVRPAWVYGGSWVDQYIRVAKERRQIVIPTETTRSQGLIHKDDLAELYRLVMESRASGIFHGVEPRPVLSEDVVGKLRDVLGVQEVTRVESPWQHIGDVGLYIVGFAVNQRIAPKRSLELGWRPQYAFLDDFARLYSS